MNIKHHITKKMFGVLEWELPFIIKHIEKLKEEVKSNYNFLSSLAKDYLLVFHYEFLLKKIKNKDFIITSINLQLSNLQLKSIPGKEFPVDIDGTGPNMLKADDSEVFSAGEWFNAWYLAVILRKNKEMADLYQTDISKVIPLNEKDHIRIGFLNFQFFYSLGTNNTPDMKLFEEMKSVTEKNLNGYYMPDVDEFPYSNYYFNFNRSLILKSIIDNNPEEFNKHLFEGLSFHKTYWSRKKGLNKGESPLCDDPQGFISWPLTALAAMAYDKGFNIEVESDYIPKFMVEGNWE